MCGVRLDDDGLVVLVVGGLDWRCGVAVELIVVEVGGRVRRTVSIVILERLLLLVVL